MRIPSKKLFQYLNWFRVHIAILIIVYLLNMLVVTDANRNYTQCLVQ